MKKKKILLTLGIAAMMGLAGCGETSTDPQTPVDPPVVTVDPVVTGITLKAEGDKTAMDIGTTLKFTATVTGEGDFNKQYTFSVDKEDIATISNEGVLTAKAEGSVVVTATAAGDATKKSSITITVNEVAVCEIKDIVKNQRKHVVGKITALTTRGLVIDDGTGAVLVYLNAAPEGYAIGDVLSVAGKVAEYHNNLQFPKDSIVKKTESTIETTTIATPTAVTAASYDEMAETIKALTPISFTATAYELESGDKKYTAFKVDDGSTHIIEPTDLPDSFGVAIGTLYNVTGYVAPYYTSSSSGSSYASFYLTAIAPKPIPVTSITVTAAGGATSVGLNETLQMGVTIAPEKASNKAVTWSVDKEDIATIDENGLLTGKTAGTVVVTATAKDGSGITGTKSIEVLQFKDPVVSLTLGTAPTEVVLGSGDVDVTVTVAGESSTSNFNPAYTPTSSDKAVATVETTETGIKITPVAAGTVTITVQTAGKNADGEQLTKTLELKVLGEPKTIELTIAEASALTANDDTKLYKVTGIAENTRSGSFSLTDLSGKSIKGYKLNDKGDFAFNTGTQKYGEFVKGEGAANPADDSLNGKMVSAIGNIEIYNGVVEIVNGKFVIESETVEDQNKPAVVKNPTTIENGSYVLKKGTDVITEESTDAVFGDTFTISDVVPATGYDLVAVKVNHGSYTETLEANAGTYTFNAWTYNEIQVVFVDPLALTPMTTTEAKAAADALTQSTSGTTTDTKISRVKGKYVGRPKTKEALITDGTTEFTVYDPGNLLTSAKVEDEIDVYGTLAKAYGTPEISNIRVISITPATYTLQIDEDIDNGSIMLSALSGVYDTMITITATPATGYKLATLSFAGDPITVQPGVNEYQAPLRKSGVVTATFVLESSKTPVTVSKTIATLATDNSWVDTKAVGVGSDHKIALDTHASFYTTGTTNNGKYYNSGKDWRLYQVGNGDLTVCVDSGYTLQSVKVTFTVGNNGILVKNPTVSLTSGTADTDVSGTSVTYTVGNSGTATNGQIKITAFEVIYVEN